MSRRILDPYPRRAHLDFFRRYPNPFYSVSFELDASVLHARAKALGASVYASMVWAFHRALLGVDGFRTRLEGDDVVLWESLRVGMTVPAPDRTFSFSTTEWSPDAEAFLAQARQRTGEASLGVDLSGGAAPDFAYYTALPGLPFTSFAHVRHADPEAGQPNIGFGKFRRREDARWVPVGMTVNHLFVDGADLGELYEAAVDSFSDAF